MNCRRVNGLLSAYLDGELTGAEMLSIREHLDGCASCLREHETLRETKRLVASLGYKSPRPDLETQLLSDAERAHRYLSTPRSPVDYVRDWFGVDLNKPVALRVHPLVATIALSLAGLYLASSALDAPADRGEGLPNYALLNPAMTGLGYLSPAALIASRPSFYASGMFSNLPPQPLLSSMPLPGNPGSEGIASVPTPTTVISRSYAYGSGGAVVIVTSTMDGPYLNVPNTPPMPVMPGVVSNNGAFPNGGTLIRITNAGDLSHTMRLLPR